MSRAQTFGKNNFSEPEKLFFNLQLEGSPFAVALWAAGKGTWKASCLLPRVSGRENEKTTFRGLKSCFLICNWKGLPLQWRSGQLEKAPEKLRACSQECLEGKIFAIWKGLPLQWRSGQLEKAPEKLRACSQECLEGKMKKQLFGAWKVVFF